MVEVIPGLIVVTPPAMEPVDFLTDLAPHLRMTGDDAEAFETLVMKLAKSARFVVEHDTQKALITRKYTQTFNWFPTSRDEGLLLLRSPAKTEDFAISYKDDNGDTQSLALGTDVLLDISRTPNQVYLKANKTWPRALREVNAIEVTYKAGYSDNREGIEEIFKEMIAMLVAGALENPEAVSSIPLYELPRPIGYESKVATVQTWYF